MDFVGCSDEIQRVARAIYRGSDCTMLECMDSVAELEVSSVANCTSAIQGSSFVAEEGVEYRIQLFGISEEEESQYTWTLSVALSEVN